MSAARSLKMPDIPVADAIASICMSMALKIDPSVSEHWNLDLENPTRVPGHVMHADIGLRILPNVSDRLAEELERERDVGLVDVVDLRDDRRVRHPFR